MEHEIGSTQVQAALDVLGIVAFGASGALLAVRRGFDVVGLTVLAFVAALGGGMIRDVLVRDTPVIFGRRSEHFDSQLYAVPAFAGSLALAVLADWRPDRVDTSMVTVALFVVAFRLAAVHYDWQAPHPRPLS